MASTQGEPSVTLWQNVKAGMTLDQLMAVQPETVPIPVERKGYFLGSCAYTSGVVTIVSEAMDVCYKIAEGKVAAVYLHNTKNASQLTYNLIKPALAAKYGAAVFDKCSPMPMGVMCKAVWRSNGVTITASNTSVVGIISVTIAYELITPSEDSL